MLIIFAILLILYLTTSCGSAWVLNPKSTKLFINRDSIKIETYETTNEKTIPRKKAKSRLQQVHTGR